MRETRTDIGLQSICLYLPDFASWPIQILRTILVHVHAKHVLNGA